MRNLAVALPAGTDRPYAVRNVTSTVNRGEILCLVGESGSGKSVIAHTTMGLLPQGLAATDGEILLAGENLLRVRQARLRQLRCTQMSMIFQEPMTALNPVCVAATRSTKCSPRMRDSTRRRAAEKFWT